MSKHILKKYLKRRNMFMIFFSCMLLAGACLFGGCSGGKDGDTEKTTTDGSQFTTWNGGDSVMNGEGGKTTPAPEGWERIEGFSDIAAGTYNKETDIDNNFASRGCRICETGAGIYYVNEAFIRVYDKQTKKRNVLCSRPDCRHEDENCAAFFLMTYRLQYYEGNLYCTEIETDPDTQMRHVGLYRVSPDGSRKERVQILLSIEEQSKEGGSYFLNFSIHRGYVYYWYYIVNAGQEYDTYANGSNCIYRVPFGKEQQGECIVSLDLSSISLTSMTLTAYGDDLYFVNEIDSGISGRLYRINTKKKQVERFELEDSIIFNEFFLEGKVLYYNTIDEDGHLKAYHLDTKKKETAYSFTETDGALGGLGYDGQFWYLFIQREDTAYDVVIYDKQFNRLGRIQKESDEENQEYETYMWGQDILFAITANDVVWSVEKSKIAKEFGTMKR